MLIDVNTFARKMSFGESQLRESLMRSKSPVLVVEDDAANREMLIRRLQRAGLNAFGVADGKSVMPAFRLRRPVCVVLDLGLPDVDGLDLLKQIRADAAFSNTAVLVVTSDSTTRRISIDYGCDAFFEKPVNFPDLLVAIDRAISERAA